MRLRRTLLWVNGYDTDKLENGIASNADCIVLDLEDLVPMPRKQEARETAAKVLKEWDFRGKERVVRINAYDSELGKEDLKVILPAKPDAIRLPKCDTPEYVLGLDKILTEFEKSNGMEPNSIELILMLETPIGVINGYQMASCCERVTAMGVGAGDLTSYMDLERDLTKDSLQLLYVKQKMVIDGHAAGVQVLDTTVISLDDMSDFVAYDTNFIKSIGFTGRSVSNFDHIDIINGVFTPSEKELQGAKNIVDGYYKAAAEGQQDVFIDGKFVDLPVVYAAERKLDYAKQIQARMEA